ncbi:hypothetical protein GCM10009646_90190 [Streptomyces aureus]
MPPEQTQLCGIREIQGQLEFVEVAHATTLALRLAAPARGGWTNECENVTLSVATEERSVALGRPVDEQLIQTVRRGPSVGVCER